MIDKTIQRLQGFEVYLEGRVIAILFLGFSSGLPILLILKTLSAWLADVGVDKSTIGLFGFVLAPYTLKFIWAPFMDRLPLPVLTRLFGRRRGWLLLTQVFLIAAIFGLGQTDPTTDLLMTALMAFLVAFFSASQDIVIDAYRIELLPEEKLAAGSANVVTGYRLGMWVAGAGALFLADDIGWSVTYALMAACILIGVVTVLLTPEPDIPATVAPGADASGIDGGALPASHRDLDDERSLYSKLAAFVGIVVGIVLSEVFALGQAWSAGTFAFLPSLPISEFGSAFEVPTPWGPLVLDGTIDAYRLAGAGLCAALFAAAFVLLSRTESFREGAIDPFRDFFLRNGVQIAIVVLVFISLFKASDVLLTLMANPFYIETGFTKSQIAWVSGTFGFFVTFVGSYVAGVLIYRIGIMTSLWISGILMMASNLMFALQAYAGADYVLFHATILIENLSGGMGTTAFVAYLASLCNRRYTAVQYALLTSFMQMLGKFVIVPSSGFLAEGVGWINFFILSTLAGLPALFLLWWLGRRVRIVEPQPAVAT